MPIGFTLPFIRTSGSIGLFETTENELDAARQNLKSLLLTNWGERPMHFHFGCNFIEFLFETRRSDDFRSAIADRIVDQVGKWLPYLRLVNLNVLFQADDASIPENGIGIQMQYVMVSRPDVLQSLFHVATA